MVCAWMTTSLQTEYENPNIVRVIDTQFDGDGLTDNLYEFEFLRNLLCFQRHSNNI